MGESPIHSGPQAHVGGRVRRDTRSEARRAIRDVDEIVTPLCHERTRAIDSVTLGLVESTALSVVPARKNAVLLEAQHGPVALERDLPELPVRIDGDGVADGF